MTFYQQQAADIVWNLTHIVPLAIFVFITTIPAEALAWSQELSTSQQPLTFILDPALSAVAIMGAESFPGSAGSGINKSRASTIKPVDRAKIHEGALIRVLAFAYSSAVSQTDADPFTTASGKQVASGTIAANFLPFNTRVRIGTTMYTVHDRMNDRYNDKFVIDVWQTTHDEALEWGARFVEMEIVSLP